MIVIIAKLFLHYYVDARYSEATNLLVWIALGFSLEGMYYGVVGYILYAKKIYYFLPLQSQVAL